MRFRPVRIYIFCQITDFIKTMYKNSDIYFSKNKWKYTLKNIYHTFKLKTFKLIIYIYLGVKFLVQYQKNIKKLT